MESAQAGVLASAPGVSAMRRSGLGLVWLGGRASGVSDVTWGVGRGARGGGVGARLEGMEAALAAVRRPASPPPAHVPRAAFDHLACI